MALTRSAIRSGLASTVQGDAVRRLGFLAVLFMAAAVFAAVLVPFMEPNVGGVRDGTIRPLWVIPLVFVLSAAMWGVTRVPGLTGERRLDVGLAWLVCLCALAALYRHWLPYDDIDVVRGASPIAVGILVFAALAPVRPAKLALVAVICSLIDVAGLGVTVAAGNPMPKLELWLWLFAPGFAVTAAAIAASAVLYGLGRSLTVAQDMGSYQLVRLLGTGGMGEVWLARHHTLARPAAIKLIKPEAEEAASERMRERFEAEAQAIAALESPNTVALYDFGITPDGTLFYVMERLDGVDLRTLLDAFGPLPPERVVHFLMQACLSLDEAHAAGLVHRDVKPANLFVCRRALEVDVVKVLDFGLVHAVEGGSAGQGVIEGTPAFMAPEAMRGAVDARSDIYALGCVAFVLLTGRPVFEAGTVAGLIRAHTSEPAPRVSEVAPVAISAALDDLVAACLDKDPARRPATCKLLGDALADIARETPWSQEDAQTWWSEHPIAPPAAAEAQPHPRTVAKTWFSSF